MKEISNLYGDSSTGERQSPKTRTHDQFDGTGNDEQVDGRMLIRSGESRIERGGENSEVRGSIPRPCANLRHGSSCWSSNNVLEGVESEQEIRALFLLQQDSDPKSEVADDKERLPNKRQDGGSIPSRGPISKIKPFQLRMHEPLGKPECPYAYRWTLNLWLFSFRIHKWIRSDDKRHFHDHPWHFLTIVLRGGYVDVSESGRDVLGFGSIRFRPASYRHYVEVSKGGALTFLITTKVVRNWGFWVKGKFKRPLRYFGKFGHPPCSEQ